MPEPTNWRQICDNVLSPHIKNMESLPYMQMLDDLERSLQGAAEQRIEVPKLCCCGDSLQAHSDNLQCTRLDCRCPGFVAVGSPKAMMSMQMENVFSRIRTLEIHLAPGADINLVQPMRVPPDLPVTVEVADPSREERYRTALKEIETEIVHGSDVNQTIATITKIVGDAFYLLPRGNDTKETPAES